MIAIHYLFSWVLLHAAIGAPEDVHESLRRARNEFAYGQYHQAEVRLKGLLYPMQLQTDADVLEARKILALSEYLQDNTLDARQEFAKILYLEPDYQLDPFSVAPRIIEVFEQVRNEQRPILDAIRQRRSDELLAKPQSKEAQRVIEYTITQRSRFATLFPFGVGQFENGDIWQGVTFAALEIILLSTNVSTYVIATKNNHYKHRERQKIQALMIGQYASLALFGVTWTLGVLHARAHFVPSIQSPPRVRDMPLEPISFAPTSRYAPGVLVTFTY